MEDTTVASQESIVEPQTQTTETPNEIPSTQETDHVVDVWDEDFKMDGEPPVVEGTVADDISDTPAPAELSFDDQYKTQLDGEQKLNEPVYIKVRGKVVDISDVNELRDLAERGLGASAKYQEMAEGRKTLQFMQDNGITQDTLDSVIASRGEQPVESDTATHEVEQIASDILGSSYASDFKEIVQSMPAEVSKQLGEDPAMLKGLAADVESGLAQRIMPMAQRYMDINGLPFIDAYVKAGRQLDQQQSSPKVSKDTLKAQPRGVTQSMQRETSVWDLSSDQMDKYFNDNILKG